MGNSILEFLEKGGDLASKEGQEVIANATKEEIKEAAMDHDQEILSAFDRSKNVFARRNVMLAIGR